MNLTYKNTTNNFTKTLNIISLNQILITSFTGIIIFLIYKNISVLAGIIISAFFSSLYTQLISLSYYNKYLALLGFPIRVSLIAIPCAILVHKFNVNLLALFSGFLICQVIYFIIIFNYAKIENKREDLKCH